MDRIRKNPIEILLGKEEFNDRLVSNLNLKICNKRKLIMNYNKSIKEIVIFFLFISPLILITTISFFYVLIFKSITLSLFFMFTMLFFIIWPFYHVYNTISPNWIIDKDRKVVHYEKSYFKYKKTGEFKFSEIIRLLYYGSSIGSLARLKFVIEIPGFGETIYFIIYQGGDDSCIRLGTILAEFMEKSFYHQMDNFKDKIF